MPARYADPSRRKHTGRHYTPPRLAAFLAEALVRAAAGEPVATTLRVLDPAVGDGGLLLSLAAALGERPAELHGFDTDARALQAARRRLRRHAPGRRVSLRDGDFLTFAETMTPSDGGPADRYDLVIANPPYVRTQVLGAASAADLARRFGLSGRVDLHHAFCEAISRVLRPGGWAGVIVPNRFLSVRAGANLRRHLDERFTIHDLWDFGDTGLFEAAVLPAVLLLRRRDDTSRRPRTRFVSIYTTESAAGARRPSDAINAIDAVALARGIVRLDDGRDYRVRRGTLCRDDDAGVWRLSTPATERWLDTVAAHTRLTFGDLGPVRVGVKTTADPVFVRTDWHRLPGGEPELLRPLVSHHEAARYRSAAHAGQRRILYPHEATPDGRRAVDLSGHPVARRYLEGHRARLEAREYLRRAGRRWYELWVPHDPAGWDRPKLVWPDIASRPTFWVDRTGAVVHGDCYWLAPAGRPRRLLWLALAVGNSRFCQHYYDLRFNNRLYAGRRRFMTQYVAQLPLPDPDTPLARRLADRARRLHRAPSPPTTAAEARLDALVRESFGLPPQDPAKL
jgi:SAM-dependent methyltransferase